MNLSLLTLVLLAVASADATAVENPVFQEMTEKGVVMSDGTAVKLPPPILADGLDAAAQRAALETAADARRPVESLVKKSYYAPVVVKVRTPKPGEGEGPAVRTVDGWFVVHGDWDVLMSEEFMESLIGPKDEGKSRIVVRSGVLSDDEVAKRLTENSHLTLGEGPGVRAATASTGERGEGRGERKDNGETNDAVSLPPSAFRLPPSSGPHPSPLPKGEGTDMTTKGEGTEIQQRFPFSTFRLFERVEISATRFSVVTRGKDSMLAAGRPDPRFNEDAEYPNQWRALLRDEQSNIRAGAPQPLPAAGGYAKITRLFDPPDAVFIEFHLVYEEPYAWFDGATLVKQKLPLMVQEKVKTFRRKLAAAGEKKTEEGE